MPIDDKERARRRRLLAAHYAAENGHDLKAILDTFSRQAKMIYNGQAFDTMDAIGQAHVYFGFSNDGAFEAARNTIHRELFTDEEIVVEGTLHGRHVREFQGFAATNQLVELPFVAIYHFDGNDDLVSERVVMNLGSLVAAPDWQPS